MSFNLVSGSVVLLVLLSAVSSGGVPTCSCPRQHAPVCGSDGQVYSNRCLLDCHTSIMGTDIQVVKKGPCQHKATAPAPQCACVMNLLPVCGTDGVTYDNICLLRCERLKNPSLEVRQQGACDDPKRSKRALLYANRYNIHRRRSCSFE